MVGKLRNENNGLNQENALDVKKKTTTHEHGKQNGNSNLKDRGKVTGRTKIKLTGKVKLIGIRKFKTSEKLPKL